MQSYLPHKTFPTQGIGVGLHSYPSPHKIKELRFLPLKSTAILSCKSFPSLGRSKALSAFLMRLCQLRYFSFFGQGNFTIGLKVEINPIFPVVLGKLYTDIYNLPRFFVQDLCENTPQRPLKHQKCRFRRSIYIFYNNTFPQNKELLHKLEWFSVKVWMKF